MAKGTSVGESWGFGWDTFFNFCMLVILLAWDGLFAFRATFEIFMLLALSQKMVIETTDLNCLTALRAESYQFAGRV